MSKSSTKRTLFAGILSPILAVAVGIGVYTVLTRASVDLEGDFTFRLSTTAVAMALPFLLTLFLAVADIRRGAFARAGKIGLACAVLSLGLAWLPVKALYDRAQQVSNLQLSGVVAPLFDTVDLNGVRHRLADHRGKVVLVNIWATWCGPCRREIPEIDRLYQRRKDEGFMVFGISTEDAGLQQGFAKNVEVSYPLLTVEGEVPEIYRQVVQYPANFLIDRQGNLQPAPSAEQPFEKLESAVGALLSAQ